MSLIPPAPPAKKCILFANTDWYLYNFRLSTALAIKEKGHEVILITPEGDHAARFAIHGLRWIRAPLCRRSLNPFREALFLLWLLRLLRRERPDVLHSFTLKCAVYGSLASRAAGIPARINAITGLGHVFVCAGRRTRVLKAVTRILMTLAFADRRTRIVVQNRDDGLELSESHVVPADRIRLIRSSGVNLRRFAPAVGRAYPDRNRPLRVLLASRLIWTKGIGEYAKAARRMRDEGRNIVFLLAGIPDEGNPASCTKPQVEAWQADGRLIWLGHVEDMPALLRAVDVMVLPSYYREGVPKCLIEAAACALPIVTTDLPGCREVVSGHGKDGLRIPPRDVDALMSAISRLDDDRVFAGALGRAAHARAVAEFDERIVLRQTLQVYDELLH